MSNQAREAEMFDEPVGTEAEPTDVELDLEMSYSTWQGSCRDPYPTMQECRRLTGHRGEHAAGFGRGRTRWESGR